MGADGRSLRAQIAQTLIMIVVAGGAVVRVLIGPSDVGLVILLAGIVWLAVDHARATSRRYREHRAAMLR